MAHHITSVLRGLLLSSLLHLTLSQAGGKTRWHRDKDGTSGDRRKDDGLFLSRSKSQ